MEIVSVIPVVINTSWTQPVDSEGDVILVPRGSIKVSGDDEKLFAVRINNPGQTATLNGAVISKGTGSYTYGLLFQNDSSIDQNGNVQFYTGKAKMEVTGSDIATGISGNSLLITGKENAPLSGTLKVSAQSDGFGPQASGIYASFIDIQSELAMKINVNTEAKNEFGFATTYGIAGFGGIQLDGLSDKFRLTAKAKSAMNADSYGIYGDTTIDGMQLLLHNPEITAVFCTNDEMALGAIKACWDSGRRVPEEVSVIGFDDIPYGRYLHPALTTVKQPVIEFGYRAVRYLDEFLKNQRTELPCETLDTELVIRDSVMDITGRNEQ